MRISDWSSDVCSSDLIAERKRQRPRTDLGMYRRWHGRGCHRGALNRAPSGITDVATAGLARHYTAGDGGHGVGGGATHRSEEHTSELQSLMRISYAVFCLKKTTDTRHCQ